MRTLPAFVIGLLLLPVATPAPALDSDSDAPVAIEADVTEIDFRTGMRTLSGNVIVTQGSMYIKADKIVLRYAGDKIDTATAYGKPVSFKQRPEGHDEDVYGEGAKLKLEHAKDLITLEKKAKIWQGQNVMTGNVIYYNMKTSKMTVKGSSTASGGKAKAATGDQPAAAKPAGRTRIIIQPDAVKQ